MAAADSSPATTGLQYSSKCVSTNNEFSGVAQIYEGRPSIAQIVVAGRVRVRLGVNFGIRIEGQFGRDACFQDAQHSTRLFGVSE